jgi:hypothetical protein
MFKLTSWTVVESLSINGMSTEQPLTFAKSFAVSIPANDSGTWKIAYK